MRIRIAAIMAVCLMLFMIPLSAGMAQSAEPAYISITEFGYTDDQDTPDSHFEDLDVTLRTNLTEYIAVVSWTDDAGVTHTKEVPYDFSQEDASMLDITTAKGARKEELQAAGRWFRHFNTRDDCQYTLYFTDANRTFRSELLSYKLCYRDDFRPYLTFIYMQEGLYVFPSHTSADFPTELYRLNSRGEAELIERDRYFLPRFHTWGYYIDRLEPGQTYTYYAVIPWDNGHQEISDYFTFTIPGDAGLK
ncbi:MAG: hypothetical protein IKK75_05540 [Clostridia bacterium]|nr:hypothetical protein [Clostridia bacterium]